MSRADAGLRAPTAAYQTIWAEGITVHYQGPSPWTPPGSFARDREASIWRADQAYHMDYHHWIDVAYTAACGPSGVRYEGRPGWARTAANGTNDGNARSLAVVYLAGDGDPLTDEAKWAFLDEQARLGVPLRWPHNRWFPTKCPGTPLDEWAAAGFPPPGHPVSVGPAPIHLPPRLVATVRLDPDAEDDGPMERRTFDLGHLDTAGCGAVIFDGGATVYPGILHEQAIRWSQARYPGLVGPFPPADGHRGGAPIVLWQQRDGWLALDFEDGTPGRELVVTVDVASG